LTQITLILGGECPINISSIYNNLTIYENKSMKDSVAIARDLEINNRADALICTAGVASELQKSTTIPIVKSDPTYFDLLETIILAEEDSGIKESKLGLVLHKSRELDINPSRLNRFANNNLRLFTYNNEQDIENIMTQMIDGEYKLLIAGPTAFRLGLKLGIKSYRLNIGEESLSAAINKAEDILAISKKDRDKNILLSTVFNLFHDGILAADNNGIIIECNRKACELFNIKREDLLGMKINNLTKDQGWKKAYKKGASQIDKLVEIRGNKLFSSMQPIFSDNKIEGIVGIFKDINQIERLGHKYRTHKAKGLIAKSKFTHIIGNSKSNQKTVEKAKAFANTNSPILIEGETGTGKEIYAQSIHNYSSRKDGPFVAINCAALPENLLESELMGYEEGAFTGAKKGGKEGLFELSHSGTIFLDEISQMPLNLQARMLRVLQEKQVMRLGGERVIHIDTRIITATNQDLWRLVQEGAFREDLYYRLKVLTLELLSLRERKEDISELINYFFNYYNQRYGPVKYLSPEEITMLKNYTWPGNVRELRSFIEQYVIISKHLPADSATFVKDYVKNEKAKSKSRPDQDNDNIVCVQSGPLNEMEKELIKIILERLDNNKTDASDFLNISRTTLWKKLNNKL